MTWSNVLARPVRGLGTGARTPHNFGLDVARFLAIGLVLGAHCSAYYLAVAGHGTPLIVMYGAIVGVELFFTLSGFLIGRLLFAVAESDPTPHGWLVFMVRRWLRTLPLYFLWLAVMPLVVGPPAHFAADLPRYLTLTQNLAWPMPPDQWFPESWSLVVEEWFYLLFAAALLGAVAATRSKKAIWPVIGAFVVVPAVARALAPADGNFIDNIYHIALLRLDAIAWGVALARLERDGSRLFRHPRAAFLAGAVLLAAVLAQDIDGIGLPMSGLAFAHLQLILEAVALCLLLAGLLRLPAPVRPLAWIVTNVAKISYGIYIMNMTILIAVVDMALRHGRGLWTIMPVSLTLIFLLPSLSFRFFEMRLLALRPRQGR
jgi:peptidoglycan/LPS O-acetylase OafA/YrhL